ncbi:MAG: 3-dehydroquinate synthase, partial [Planctomycetota bacterium]
FHRSVDMVLSGGISKNSCIISMGGGVVNNLCGVIAGLLYRGIKLVHITTTSMGMLDASIDFKQAFNHECGKYLIGCYYPASLIVMDPCVLESLGPRHTLNGIAEALKHGLTQSEALVHTIVDPLREHGAAILTDGQYIEDLCKHTIEIKVPTLTHYHESDFNEMVPQYGHAIAHAIEHLSWHDGRSALLHGEAVAIGMCVTAEVSFLMDLCDEECVEKHYAYVGWTGLPVYVPADMALDEVMLKMTYDKHYVKQPTMGLCQAVGVMAPNAKGSFAWSVETDTIRMALERNVQKRRSRREADWTPPKVGAAEKQRRFEAN